MKILKLKLCKFGDKGYCNECGASWDRYSGGGCDCDDDL